MHTQTPGGSVGGQGPGTAQAKQGWRAGRPSATGRASPGQAGGEAAEWGARGGGGHPGGARAGVAWAPPPLSPPAPAVPVPAEAVGQAPEERGQPGPAG